MIQRCFKQHFTNEKDCSKLSSFSKISDFLQKTIENTWFCFWTFFQASETSPKTMIINQLFCHLHISYLKFVRNYQKKTKSWRNVYPMDYHLTNLSTIFIFESFFIRNFWMEQAKDGWSLLIKKYIYIYRLFNNNYCIEFNI